MLLSSSTSIRRFPGLGSFLNGRTWEKGGFTPHLRGILDDKGAADGADQLEHRHGRRRRVVERGRSIPGYIKWTAQAYQMLINEVIYTLTH